MNFAAMAYRLSKWLYEKAALQILKGLLLVALIGFGFWAVLCLIGIVIALFDWRVALVYFVCIVLWFLWEQYDARPKKITPNSN